MSNFTANVQLRQILLKRGNLTEAGSYVGPVGEIVVDTTLNTLRVQDGVTPGGWPLESASGIILANTIYASGNTTTGFSPIFAGLQSGYYLIPNLLGQFTANANSYAQLNLQNINSGQQATTDYVATADNGTDSTFYVDMGIASSTYDGTHPANNLGTAIYANDAYIYTQGNNPGDVGGNLLVGAVTQGKHISFMSGGHDQANIALQIFNPNTSPINNSTGTMVVKGGVGIQGNINVGQYNTSIHNILGNLVLGYGANIVASADSILTINLNNTVPILAANNTVHLSGADGKIARLGIDSFGSVVNSGIFLRTARGTSGAPTATQSGDIIGLFATRGYGTTGFIQSGYASGIHIRATENYTDTAQGTVIEFLNVPIGSNVPSTTMTHSSYRTSITGNIGVTGTTHTIIGNLVLGGNTSTPSASAVLTVSPNPSLAININSNATVYVSGLSGTAAKVTADTYNNGDGTVGSIYVARSARGTATSPSASQSGDVLGAFLGRGWGTNSYTINAPLRTPGMVIQASQNFSDSNQGTNLLFNVTANNTINASTVMTVAGSGQVNIAGNLVVSGYTTLANLTQTQIAALTPVPGMMVYNYTYGNAQIYTAYLGRWGNVVVS